MTEVFRDREHYQSFLENLDDYRGSGELEGGMPDYGNPLSEGLTNFIEGIPDWPRDIGYAIKETLIDTVGNEDIWFTAPGGLDQSVQVAEEPSGTRSYDNYAPWPLRAINSALEWNEDARSTIGEYIGQSVDNFVSEPWRAFFPQTTEYHDYRGRIEGMSVYSDLATLISDAMMMTKGWNLIEDVAMKSPYSKKMAQAALSLFDDMQDTAETYDTEEGDPVSEFLAALDEPSSVFMSQKAYALADLFSSEYGGVEKYANMRIAEILDERRHAEEFSGLDQ